ncbi:MAG: hypothetical protein AB7I18_01340 [Candidatus Berkiella sp.]
MVDTQLSENCTATLDDCWKECIRCKQLFLEKYWDEELDWYIELNLSNECQICQQPNSK